jgi:hypothetical protein
MNNEKIKLSAGICDSCIYPEIKNTGDGINEPFDPILYCEKKEIEICPEMPSDQIRSCKFFNDGTPQCTNNNSYSLKEYRDGCIQNCDMCDFYKVVL